MEVELASSATRKVIWLENVQMPQQMTTVEVGAEEEAAEEVEPALNAIKKATCPENVPTVVMKEIDPTRDRGETEVAL